MKNSRRNSAKALAGLLSTLFVSAGLVDLIGQPADVPQANEPNKPEEVVKMDQFEIVTTQGHGYVSPNAAEAFKTNDSLMDIPQIDVVVTNDLLHDIGFENLSDTLAYFGVYAPFQGDALKLRGGGSSTQLYLDEVPVHAGWTDPSVIDTVEIIKGGTEGLYMLNSGLGGIVMQSEKKPLPYEQTTFSAWVDQIGLWRAGIDTTGPLGKIGGVELGYRLLAAYQKGHSYFSNIVDNRKLLYPYFQAKYKNTTARFHLEADSNFGSSTGEDLMTPTGELWTGAGRAISNQPPNNMCRLWNDVWEGTILQKFSDTWEMRLTGQYFYQGQFQPQVLPTAYNWDLKEMYYLNRINDERWHYWTILSDVTGRYDFGPANWEMKNTDILGWAFTSQNVQKYIYSSSVVPFSDASRGVPLMAGQPSNTLAVPMASAAAINAIVNPPLNTYYFPSKGAGSHLTTWNGGFYLQHTTSVIPNWFDVILGEAWVSVITDQVTDVSQVPWVANELHFNQWVHRIAGVVHLGREVSIYGLSTTNFSPPSTSLLQANGTEIPPQWGKDNEIGLKTAFMGGRISTDFSWFEMVTTNIPEVAGTFANGSNIYAVVGLGEEEGVDGDVAFILVPGWQLVGSWYAGHDRDQSNFPISGTWDNSWGLFTRYDFRKGTPFDGLTIGAGMNRIGGRWVSNTGIVATTADYRPITLVNGGEIEAQTGTMMNAFVQYAFNKHLVVSVNCTNVLAEVFPLYANPLITDPSQPRLFRFEADYRF